MRRCNDFCPPTWSGRWEDWHKGHGCDIEARVMRDRERRRLEREYEGGAMVGLS